MVAAVVPQPDSPPKRAKIPALKGDGRLRAGRVEIPLQTRLRVRNLYLGQHLPYKEIAVQVGLTVGQVEGIVIRDKLPAIKRSRKQKLTEKTDARVDAAFREFEDQAAREAEEISLGALAKARGEVESGGEFAPKNFQAWTQGISNLVKVSRTMRGLDQPQAQAGAGTTNIALQLFCVQGDLAPVPAAKAEPVSVQPIHELAPAPTPSATAQ